MTSAEQLLDSMDLPLNETEASWVVRAACGLGESLQGSKLFVLLAGDLCGIVTDDFLWSTKY